MYSGAVASSQIAGGVGGYSSRTITITSPTTLNVVVGGKGGDGVNNATAPGGYNGGGNGNILYAPTCGGGGGGASHIAITAGILNSLSGNQAAVLIVGGAGGGGGNQSIGGHGGGLNGVQPANNTQFANRTAGGGGSQTGAGVCSTGGSGAAFGQGGTTNQNFGGGGGGGWYGGCTGENSTGGGGGSGYIGGAAGASALVFGSAGFITNPDVSGNGRVVITSLYGVQISQTASITCNGLSTAALTATVSGGAAPFTYSWAPAGGTASVATGLAAGVYTCFVNSTVTGSVSGTFTITQPTSVSSSISTQTNVTCNGGNNGRVVLTTAGGTAPYTYSWIPTGSTSATLTNAISGSYTCITKDANSCDGNTVTTVITQPASFSISASGANTLICGSGSSTLTASGATTYTWTNGVSNGVGFSPTATTNYSVTASNALGCPASNTAVVSVVVAPIPNINVNSGAICAGQIFTMNPSGASTYTLQGGNAVVNPSASTSYTVRGTSAAGCLSANTATSTVTVNANPTITVNSGTICAGQNFTLLPAGANTYTFQGGNAVVSPSLTTSYTVAGTNTLTGCSSQSSATSTLTVNQNPTLTVTGINTICAGQSASLVANGAATYTWSNAANTTSVVLTPSANTAYTLSGSTALGCTAAINPTVAVQPSITVNVAGPNSICNGQTASLTASGATSYTWNTAASSASIAATLSTSTTYSVIGVTGVCANFAVKTITVTPNPTVSITGTTAICSGSSASLTVNGATTYTWSTLSTNTSVVVSPSATTVYSVVGSFSTGCSQLAAQTVSVYALPVVSISGPSVICVGDSITLNANGAATYVWDNAATTASIVVSPSATASYSAVGTDTNGCIASASTSMTVNPVPVMSVVKTTSAVCQGDSLSFTATGADTYSWSTGAITNSIVVTPTSSATYSVVGTNTFGCISLLTDSVKVNAVPVLTITGNTGTICIGETLVLNLNGAATYSWSTGASTSSISVSPSIASTYSATGTSTDACVSAITASVQVSECTGLNAHTSATSVKVYPNPSNGEFTLELSSVNKSVITITTILGQVVLSQEAGLIQQINLSELNKGLYFINVTENNKSVYRTNIVKQ